MEKIAVQESGCWHWTAFCMKNGYGLFRMADRHHLAHRISFSLLKGKIPEGLDVMHTCDNPKCVNPAHLTVGTRVDNMQDCKRKNRNTLGERHGRAKLTEAQALEVKKATGFQKDIAKLFGISQATVSDIKLGRKWSHLQAQ